MPIDQSSKPPYAFVPGYWPHPVLHTDGHRYQQSVPAVNTSCSTDWITHPHWQRAIDLFDEGYYWEAHEYWEAFWIHSQRTHSVHSVLSGLILLAAAAIKLRQGHDDVAQRLVSRAVGKWRQSHDPIVFGWDIAALIAFAEEESSSLSSARLDPKRPVEAVYERRLARCLRVDEEDSAR